ncbi:MAG: NAD(P)/FAD-dependent oxidoreductase [Bacilli bacterium]|nr:NAD(P)/FAD-dependent oxidoreductase [Bacilli bacterium]
MLYDVIIVGFGPSAISGALYTCRAGLKTLVIGKKAGSLLKTKEIENYYGFATPISGEELLNNGLKQASRLGATLLEAEVVDLTYLEHFEVTTTEGKYEAKTVLLATGTSRRAPSIPGLKEYEGRGVSYCATCDGFFYRDLEVAVLGTGNYALEEAMYLKNIAKQVYLLANEGEINAKFPSDIQVLTKKIQRIEGQDKLQKVVFIDGSSLAISGLFIALGVASSTDLAKKVGAITKDNYLVVNDKMQTNVPHLSASGDCVGGLLQINKAVYQGCLAATNIINDIKAEK